MTEERKKILLVEPDLRSREAIKDGMSKSFFVKDVANPEEARRLLETESFDLIVSDMMTDAEGVALLTWVKITHPMPVVLMIGSSQIEETQRAHDLGADDFILKPFSVQELRAKLEGILEELKKEEEQHKDSDQLLDGDFCRVPIDDFISEKELDHNIFVRLSEGRYVKVLHKGGKIDPERVRGYKEKGVYHLYIRQEDFRQILGFTVKVAKAAAEQKHLIDPSKKTRFLKFTGEMIVQNAFVVGVDKEALHSAKDFLESCMSVLADDYDSFTLLEMLSEHTDLLYAHSVGVSAFSVMIGKQLGWRSPRTLFKLAFGGLFHDIGKKEVSRHILNKPRLELTLEEKKELETHVTLGKEILESMRSIPAEAIRIAYEHHENLLGHGYPRRLRRKGIHPLTLVVSVANNFCMHTIKTHEGHEVKTGPEAVDFMEKYEKDGLDSTVFRALKSLVRDQNR